MPNNSLDTETVNGADLGIVDYLECRDSYRIEVLQNKNRQFLDYTVPEYQKVIRTEAESIQAVLHPDTLGNARIVSIIFPNIRYEDELHDLGIELVASKLFSVIQRIENSEKACEGLAYLGRTDYQTIYLLGPFDCFLAHFYAPFVELILLRINAPN